MKQFFENIYRQYGIKRRFRQVSDGLWIFGDLNCPAGIFIDRQDWQENTEFYAEYLFDVDDELIRRRALTF